MTWPIDNPDSWRRIREFIAEMPGEGWDEWQRIARSLIVPLASEGLDVSFRIGQSMSHIIFSTTDHHRLLGEPRVTLEIHTEEKKVRVAYSTANLGFNPALEETIVAEPEALSEIKRMLRKLWVTTRPTIDLPLALQHI